MRSIILGVGGAVFSSATALAGFTDTAIPEPASLALLATSAGALIVYHWRRKK
jgi:hypothetical protein